MGNIVDINEHKRAEESLRESEERYRSLVESTEDSIYLVDRNCRYLFMNQKHISRFGLTGNKPIGKTYSEFHSEEETKEFANRVKEVFETSKSLLYEYRSQRDSGYFLRTLSPVKEPDGTIEAVTVVSKDITEHKLAEEALRERETELEEKVLVNVRELVLPFLKKVKNGRLDAEQLSYIDILQSNLNDIISPFMRNLSTKYANLTPTEIRVAHLIREGKTTKEIGEMMTLSPRTIESHRDNMRKKLGLKDKKANLRSHLLSIQ